MSDEPSCSNDLDPQLPRCAWLLACSVSRKDASPQSSASARRIPGRILSGNGVHRFRNHCSNSPEYATLAEFWRRNKELERFNAIFNFKAKSLDDAHKLIKWFDEYDLDHKKFARLKGWFDIEKLEIKKATRTQAVGFMLLGIAFALVSVPPLDLGLRNAALIKFKGESQWIWLDHDQAYNSPYNLTKDWRFTARTCSQETFSAESAAKETQLKTETIASICDSFTNAADAARIDEIIKGQKIFLVFALQFIIFAISSFTEIFRRLTAVETAAYLANRKRIKAEANEQSSSSNARNTEPTQETSEVAS
ncbi:DUF6216 family protein [Aeromonas hydrophila]|uniref:DUF6216 family protein n=1 Tax=Aeromonas hydrophila TaxID=644 RepID=UPI0021F43F41|nr:DUF6216 family protein [Aeromonas hydrophila]MCV9382707.1 DUF6216 family protein [Aeromonas hydrophila]